MNDEKDKMIEKLIIIASNAIDLVYSDQRWEYRDEYDHEQADEIEEELKNIAKKYKKINTQEK